MTYTWMAGLAAAHLLISDMHLSLLPPASPLPMFSGIATDSMRGRSSEMRSNAC